MTILSTRRRRTEPPPAPQWRPAELPRGVPADRLRGWSGGDALDYLHHVDAVADILATRTVQLDPVGPQLFAELGAIQTYAALAPQLLNDPAVRMALAPIAAQLAEAEHGTVVAR